MLSFILFASSMDHHFESVLGWAKTCFIEEDGQKYNPLSAIEKEIRKESHDQKGPKNRLIRSSMERFCVKYSSCKEKEKRKKTRARITDCRTEMLVISRETDYRKGIRCE